MGEFDKKSNVFMFKNELQSVAGYMIVIGSGYVGGPMHHLSEKKIHRIVLLANCWTGLSSLNSS